MMLVSMRPRDLPITVRETLINCGVDISPELVGINRGRRGECLDNLIFWYKNTAAQRDESCNGGAISGNREGLAAGHPTHDCAGLIAQLLLSDFFGYHTAHTLSLFHGVGRRGVWI